MPDLTTEIAVIGAGPAGLTAALSLDRLGLAVTVLAPPYDVARTARDLRTTALIGPSVEFMKNLGVWSFCRDHAAPIAAVRIADDRETVVRAPEVLFRACELDFDAFGANVPNGVLQEALNRAAEDAPRLSRIATAAVTAIEPEVSEVRLRSAEGGLVSAKLVIAADGRNSIGPSAAGLTVRSWTYPQSAIVAIFEHTRRHEGIVNELHRRAGPLTTVPLPGLSSSLVWVEEPQEAHRIADLADDAFAALLEDRLQGVLGTIRDVGPRMLYRLSGASADRMGARRIALVGESAHVIPPIGAQGLNLGLRDAAALADCVFEAKSSGGDVGASDVLEAFHRARSTDVGARTAAIDLLNRSLLADLVPLDLLRGAAAHALARSGTLRRLLMQGGLGAGNTLPRLMRPNAQGANA